MVKFELTFQDESLYISITLVMQEKYVILHCSRRKQRPKSTKIFSIFFSLNQGNPHSALDRLADNALSALHGINGWPGSWFSPKHGMRSMD